jgi:putative copper resistance protein D
MVAQLLDIFAFVSVLLRGMTLAFEALTVGGVIFVMTIAKSGSELARRLSHFVILFSILLAATQVFVVGLTSAILMNSANLTWAEVQGANYCIAGTMIVIGAAMVGAFAGARPAKFAWLVGCLLILFGTVMTSHSTARLDYRGNLIFLTLVHHAAGAAWIGGLPYLVWALRAVPNRDVAQSITGRFSRMAIIIVPVLIVAGATMALLYVGSPSALTGTTYGIMLSSKVILTALLLLLGALNLRIVRAVRNGTSNDLLPLRRFGETEVGIGFTVLLAAASLTSVPPAVDVTAGRVTIREIVERIKPAWPRMWTPALRDLSPATPLTGQLVDLGTGSLVPGQSAQPNTLADRAWSEYNHHWAGLVVLSAGILSLLAHRISCARHWPLIFLGLAVFLFVRADAENWPLGPGGFWESFQVAEVAQHRLFVVVIVALGTFEWAVRTRRVAVQPAGLIFPLACAAGGALLLTHSHSLGNVKEEFLAELSHTPLAILAVVAGWSRWLEIRLPQDQRRILMWIWPVCFVTIGALLLNYRES